MLDSDFISQNPSVFTPQPLIPQARPCGRRHQQQHSLARARARSGMRRTRCGWQRAGPTSTAVRYCCSAQHLTACAARGCAVSCAARADRRSVTCLWAILCTNRRLGLPRSFTIRDEGRFSGEIRRGLSGDACDLIHDHQTVLVLGHGPYATEHMRTSLEHGATRGTFAVRRHGLISPEAVDYVTYIREYDGQFNRPSGGTTQVVLAWQQTYRDSTATPPEAWKQGSFVPEGHAVSVSDTKLKHEAAPF